MPSVPNVGTGVSAVFATYPPETLKRAMQLRHLVLDTAAELAEVDEVKETLKWGEPSYVTKTGSTIRLGWKASRPDECRLLFHCRTKLVDTFKRAVSRCAHLRSQPRDRLAQDRRSPDCPVETLHFDGAHLSPPQEAPSAGRGAPTLELEFRRVVDDADRNASSSSPWSGSGRVPETRSQGAKNLAESGQSRNVEEDGTRQGGGASAG